MALDAHLNGATPAARITAYMRRLDTAADRAQAGNWRRRDADAPPPPSRPTFSLADPSTGRRSTLLANHTGHPRALRPPSSLATLLSPGTLTGLLGGGVGGVDLRQGGGGTPLPHRSGGRRHLPAAPATVDHVGVLPHGGGFGTVTGARSLASSGGASARLGASVTGGGHTNASCLAFGPEGLGPR